MVFDPLRAKPAGHEPADGDARTDVGTGRRAAVVIEVASRSTIAALIARARSWPPRRRSTAFTTRRCAGAAREDELAGVEQAQARVARKCRRPGYEARCCAIWEKRVRLGHWDLRIALRGRNLSEVRSCCRSEDRPHIDALGHRLYSVSGDEQPATDRAARVPACGVRRRGPTRLTGPASRGRRRGRWDRG